MCRFSGFTKILEGLDLEKKKNHDYLTNIYSGSQLHTKPLDIEIRNLVLWGNGQINTQIKLKVRQSLKWVEGEERKGLGKAYWKNLNNCLDFKIISSY